MYLSSDSALLTDQRRSAACRAARARECVNNAKYQMADGRAQLFQTVIPPETVATTLGIPAAVNVKRLQDQSLQSRAAILAGQSGQAQDIPLASVGDFISGAPRVSPLNGGAIPCTQIEYEPRPLAQNPTPTMPARAPSIVKTTLGPMYVDSASPAQSWQMGGASGLTGYSAPWSDAFVSGDGGSLAQPGVIGWVQSHPWLTFGLAAGVGLIAASSRKRGRR